MHNAVRVAGALAIAAIVPLIATSPASAASAPQGFNVSTTSGASTFFPGWANAVGSVSYNGAYSFNISGTITDRCPKDGNSAFAYYEVSFVGGGTSLYYISRDSSGCDDGISGNLGYGKTFTSRIKAVRIKAIEGYMMSDGRRALSGDSADWNYSTWKDNPYT